MTAQLCGTLPATLYLRCASSRLLRTWHVRHNVSRGRHTLKLNLKCRVFWTLVCFVRCFGMPKNRKRSLNKVMKKWEFVQWNFVFVFLPAYFYVKLQTTALAPCLHLDDLCSRCLAEWWVGGSFLTASLPALFCFPPTHLYTKTTQYSQHFFLFGHTPSPNWLGSRISPKLLREKNCCVLILTHMSIEWLFVWCLFRFCTFISAIRFLIFKCMRPWTTDV